MAQTSRGKVIQAYKGLLTLGRDYPKGYEHFRGNLRKAFEKNRSVSDPEQISQLLDKCDDIARDLRTLYHLRQFRHCNPRAQDTQIKRRSAI